MESPTTEEGIGVYINVYPLDLLFTVTELMTGGLWDQTE